MLPHCVRVARHDKIKQMPDMPDLETVTGMATSVVSEAEAKARLAAPFYIGPVRISQSTVLAPMAGVTDTVFRRLIRNQGGCGLMMTEFTSSHGVVSSRRARKPI